MSLRVVLNGQKREFDSLSAGDPLKRLISELDLKSDRIAIERNGEIVSRGEWAEVRLCAGDRLEIVHFVGGGGL